MWFQNAFSSRKPVYSTWKFPRRKDHLVTWIGRSSFSPFHRHWQILQRIRISLPLVQNWSWPLLFASFYTHKQGVFFHFPWLRYLHGDNLFITVAKIFFGPTQVTQKSTIRLTMFVDVNSTQPVDANVNKHENQRNAVNVDLEKN